MEKFPNQSSLLQTEAKEYEVEKPESYSLTAMGLKAMDVKTLIMQNY